MQESNLKKKPSSPVESVKGYKNGFAEADQCLANRVGNQTGKTLCKEKKSFEKNSSGDSSGFDSGVTQDFNDGTDSGVEVIRALSSNESHSDRFTPIQSCGSSLVSYSSEPDMDRGSECGSESSEKSRLRKGNDGEEKNWKSKKSYVKGERARMDVRKCNSFDEGGTSESCSETSSTHEAITPDQLNRPFGPDRSFTVNRLQEGKKYESDKSVLRRSEAVSRTSRTYERPWLRSQSSVRTSNSSSKITNPKMLPSNRNGLEKSETKASKHRQDLDAKWSSYRRNQNSSGSRIRVSSEADPSRRNGSHLMSSSLTSSGAGKQFKNGNPEVKADALDKYGTLPRRPKNKFGEPQSSVLGHLVSQSRSNSATREPNLNRAATLRNQRTKEKEIFSDGKSLPPYPRMKKGTLKTVIYHEVSVQTIITREDIGSMRTNNPAEAVVEKESRGIQTEGKERLKKLEEDYVNLSERLREFTEENEKLKSKNKKILEKISKLLGRPNCEDHESGKKELEELEQHFKAVGLTVIKQQEELSELRRYKAIAHRDLQKSLAAQKNLLQQQQEIEEEYSELQEFLQAEKIALSESLLDNEVELKRLNEDIAKKESLIEQQQEECKHLVRICEQRRQENLSLEAKLAGLDQRSRDVLVQQGAAVSAAAVALSGLGARLDNLVEQLTVSCNISEKDLEDLIFHNEAYNKSEDSSPDETPSKLSSENPKRGESLLQVILEAIRNAAKSSFSKKNGALRNQSDRNVDRLSFSSESEPCLNLETALDENSFSNCIDFELSIPRENNQIQKESNLCDEESSSLHRSDSLQNLSEAILNRQAVEKQERSLPGASSLDEIIPIEVNSLVDQIIDVDNSVTKLLKVIRIIQVESENRMKELKGERVVLTSQLHEKEKNQKKLERNLQRLQQELTEARYQLNLRISQLEEAKSLCGNSQRVAVVEMQKRFAIIDNALGALNSVQDMVNKCPPLAQLRQDLEDCNYENLSGDVNANEEAGNENVAITHQNSTVLTTAI